MANIETDKPIKVCFVSPKAYPLFNPDVRGVFGGAEVDLYYLGTELARDADFSVTFITADYGQGETETIEGIKVIKSLNFAQNPMTSALKILRAMRKADADIYMLKTASPGTPLVAGFCQLGHKAFVYRTAHQRECDGTYLKDHFLLGRAFAWSLRRAAIVFAQNSTDAEALADTIAVDAHVLPNGHRIEPLTQNDRDSILWVGRSAPFKRPELFIDLAEKNPDKKFVMICQRATGDRGYEKLCQYVRGIGNIEFHSRVPFHQIDTFFQRAKVLVNTSDSEGFANTFIQACKWAVPILSLNVDPDDFLQEHNCGLCCNGYKERLMEGLEFLCTDNRYVELGLNGRKYAEANHDIFVIVEKYKQIFRQL